MAQGKTKVAPQRITPPSDSVPPATAPSRISAPLPATPTFPVASVNFGEGVEELPDQVLSPKARRTKQILMEDQRVRFFVPLGFNEKQPAYQDVQINGYRLRIQKGVYVDIPQKVADVIKSSEKDTQSAISGQTIRNQSGGIGVGADRNNPTSDALAE